MTRRVFDRLDLIVWGGECVAITGPSGCGKTTLLQIMGLLDKPTDGDVTLFGRNALDMSDVEASRFRAAHLGFVFQGFHLLHGRSLLENVMLPLVYSNHDPKRSRRDRAMDYLDRVGLASRASSRPSELSGGEQQRVAIARAIASQPRMLLCDEPTGNLDATTTTEILDLIDAIRHDNVAVVIATHDPIVSERADRTVSLTAAVPL